MATTEALTGSSSASEVTLEPSKSAEVGAVSAQSAPRFRPPEAGAAVRICLGHHCHVTGHLGLLPRSSDNWRWSPAEPRRTTRTGLLVCGTTLVALDAPWRILPPGAPYGHPALISQSHIDDRGGVPVPGPAIGRASERHLGSRQLESHLLVRPCPGRRRPSTIRMMPTMAMMSPMESHMRLPVMKLPGIRFMPCPANTPPRIRAITPRVIRAMRPVRLVTSPNLPSTDSWRRSTAPRVSVRYRTDTDREG